MKKYREELDQIHMSDDLKQRIRKAALEQEEQRHRHHCNRRYLFHCAAVCAVAVLCTGLYWMNKESWQPEEAAQIAKNMKEDAASDETAYGSTEDVEKESKTGSAQKRVVPQEAYYPQTHTYMGSMGVQDTATTQKKKVKLLPYENDHLHIKDDLPVFKSRYGDGRYMDSIPEKAMREQEEKAEKLLKAIKKTPSNIIQITDVFADGDGELRLVLETDKKEGTRTQQHELAEELLKTYPQLFSFEKADIQTSCNISMGTGMIACKTDIFKADKDDKKGLLNQVRDGIVLSDAGDGRYYVSIPYESKLKQLQEYSIMSSEEAQKVMYQGGYYSVLKPTEFSLDQLEILYVELTYGGRDNIYASYQPYIVPVYRFYTWDANALKPVILEVPALYPQDLRELTENDWYFKN